MGHLAGMLVLGPAVYCWLLNPRLRVRDERAVEFLVVLVLSAAIAELRFGGWIQLEVANSLPYLVVPGLFWCAFRLGPRETSSVAFVSSSVAIAHTWRNVALTQAGQAAGPIFAPFVSHTLNTSQSLIMLQVFVSTVSVTAMALAAAVAERTRFQEDLNESEARFRTIFEQAAVGVALADAAGRFVRINQRYCDLLGYSADELMQKTVQEVTHPDDLPSCLENMQRMIACRERNYSMEKRYIRKDGTTIWVNLSVSPTWHANEAPANLIGVIEDITTRKQAEEDLRSAHTKLQQLSREMIRVRDNERRHLARELHDEIGQNLAALRINMQLLRGPEDFSEESQRIDDSICIIDRILEEVRHLSLSLRPPLLNESGLAVALGTYVKEQSARCGLPIGFESSVDDVPVRPEIALALFRISQEALTNAVRYANAERVSVSLDRVNDDILLVIEDDGVGIPRGLAEEPGPRPRLGLLGMQERTAQLGGSFTVKSEPGNGTVVSVQVPLKLK
jgi:two-component system sensor histidine kinase UhpB